MSSIDFDSWLIPPDPPECGHILCDYCGECHAEGCFLHESICDSAQEELTAHEKHVLRNIYWGGCAMCIQEEAQHEADIVMRKITHVAFRPPYDGTCVVRGIVQGAKTKEDLVWVIEAFDVEARKRMGKPLVGAIDDPELEALARVMVAEHPLAQEAIWLTDSEFQEMIEGLPSGRKPCAYVDFGPPEGYEYGEYYV